MSWSSLLSQTMNVKTNPDDTTKKMKGLYPDSIRSSRSFSRPRNSASKKFAGILSPLSSKRLLLYFIGKDSQKSRLHDDRYTFEVRNAFLHLIWDYILNQNHIINVTPLSTDLESVTNRLRLILLLQQLLDLNNKIDESIGYHLN